MSKDEDNFRVVKVTENAADPETGVVLCPQCGHGAVWVNDKGQRVTSPMQRLKIPGKVDALVHRCCGQAMFQRAFVHNKPSK